MDLSITMEKTRIGVEAFAYKDQENNISGVGFFPAYPSPETWIPFGLSRDSAVTVTIKLKLRYNLREAFCHRFCGGTVTILSLFLSMFCGFEALAVCLYLPSFYRNPII